MIYAVAFSTSGILKRVSLSVVGSLFTVNKYCQRSKGDW